MNVGGRRFMAPEQLRAFGQRRDFHEIL